MEDFFNEDILKDFYLIAQLTSSTFITGMYEEIFIIILR